MAVSSTRPVLEEAWIALQFQLAGLRAGFDGDIPEAVLNARDDAYGMIEAEYRGLPSIYPGQRDVEIPAYDICEREDELQESEGRLVVAISFVSPYDFTDEAIAELKALCTAKFAEAAATHGIECVFASVEGWRRLSYVERIVIEV
ncbi:hypothetical protein [Trinickia diaoshuihuensis]|uniref:hypothetical protein n=1 Tax=Trinickia diaoshuihuensis TaxID=2292265 RepID=UPI000E23973E|nr:hypothetical protein [Trinickia diaoshuihuensis]